MKVVLQRVKQASVAVDGTITSSIAGGYLLFLGILRGDTEMQADFLAEKVSKLRLFDGLDAKINDRSILEIQGEILVVSQFTLAGRTEKGNRPDYTAAEKPERARELYDYFVQKLCSLGITKVQTGTFGEHMEVSLTNDGPVTLLLEY
jgi:D-tyrosyl-tRNA(Tyr) deacylase